MILNYTQFSEKHLSGSFKLAFALFLSVIVSTPILAYPKGKRNLSFSTSSLTYSVGEDGTTANKSTTLWCDRGNANVTLTKSAGWIVLPSPGLGSLSFGINATGLASGSYSADVSASAPGCNDATLRINLTVTSSKKLSFSTSSISYSVVRNGATAKKSATLSASTGSPTISLSKSAPWVVLPSAGLGFRSFGINSSGLLPGNYSATVTASAIGYKSASLHISLTIIVQKKLSFSTSSLSYSVVQNGTTAEKSATLSASTGSPAISLSKSAPWVVLPSAGLGYRSFGINSSGLSPGNYSATVTASAIGYKSASLYISLTIIVQKKLSFSTRSLSYSVVQNGTTAKKSATLSASTGTPAISLSKSARWVVLPSAGLGSRYFGINSSGLSP